MELRSGRIVKYSPYTRRDINNLAKTLSQLSLADEEECKIIEESKIFFRYLFYEAFEYFGVRAKLDEIGRSQGRRAHFFESFNWKIDETFWKETFENAIILMRRRNVNTVFFTDAFYYFIKNEHPKLLKYPDSFSRMKTKIAKYLQTLFYQKNCERIVSITKEREQVKERMVPVADKKVYFIKIAHYIALRISLHPQLYTPNWKDIFTTVKELFAYVDIEGGYTVCQVPLMVCNFTNPPSYSYCFDILETNERFNSPEGDPRKAFLLEKQLEGQQTIST